METTDPVSFVEAKYALPIQAPDALIIRLVNRRSIRLIETNAPRCLMQNVLLTELSLHAGCCQLVCNVHKTRLLR